MQWVKTSTRSIPEQEKKRKYSLLPSIVYLPKLESFITSATDNRGSATYDDILVRSPSRQGVEDLAEKECKDKELPKLLCIFSFMGLQEETDEASSLELSQPSSTPSYVSFALTYKDFNFISIHLVQIWIWNTNMAHMRTPKWKLLKNFIIKKKKVATKMYYVCV